MANKVIIGRSRSFICNERVAAACILKKPHAKVALQKATSIGCTPSEKAKRENGPSIPQSAAAAIMYRYPFIRNYWSFIDSHEQTRGVLSSDRLNKRLVVRRL